MPWTLPACAGLLALPLLAGGNEPPETVIRMTVTPMAAPRPALKYQLLPELREMNPGNPVLAYSRCFMEQNHFFFDKKEMEKREKWTDMPLKDLPVLELRNYGGIALLQADYAARLDTPDWQVLLKLKKEGLHLLLPDVQQLRMLAWALQVRFRGEVADRRFKDALVTAKTMFALSRHLGEHPTLISDLVGIAIANITIGNVDEMIGQPGCPNLYWALTDLPRPFISLRGGLQGERMMLDAEAALLDEQAPMSAGQLRKVLERFGIVFALAGQSERLKEVRAWFYARVNDKAHLRAARQRLVESGLDANKVKGFPPMQVVLLDEKLTFDVQRDEVMKAMMLPYWQAQPLLARSRPGKDDKGSPVAWLVPRLEKVRMAQARLDQRIALLRCVEALRLYAAAHDGKLPAMLADVPVPLPVDPITGKAFVFRLDGATAVVRGSAPPGMERSADFNVRYEVTIRK
jgi:hypothetical protein